METTDEVAVNAIDENIADENTTDQYAANRIDKKSVKKDSNRVAIALILYMVINFAVIMVHMVVCCVYEILNSLINELPEPAWEEMEARFLESGTSSILGVILGTLFLILFFKKRISFKELFQITKKPDAICMGQLLCIFMGGQFVFGIGGELLEKILNVFGYSAIQSMETASAVSTTVSMFLYSSIVGPIAEEIVYRGFVLRSFQKYGKMTALIVSSVLFGVMHANLPQGIFAFGVGLVLGYVAMEYSIGWSIALHIFNNCIFCDLLGLATSGLSMELQNAISLGLSVMFAVIAIVIVWKKREYVIEFCKKNRSPQKIYLYVFTSIAVVVFVAAELALAISELQVL